LQKNEISKVKLILSHISYEESKKLGATHHQKKYALLSERLKSTEDLNDVTENGEAK
jgi:hypothetical protein